MDQWNVSGAADAFYPGHSESAALDQDGAPFWDSSCIRPPPQTNKSTTMIHRAVFNTVQKASADVTKGRYRGDRNSIRAKGLPCFDRGNDVLIGQHRKPQNSLNAELWWTATQAWPRSESPSSCVLLGGGRPASLPTSIAFFRKHQTASISITTGLMLLRLAFSVTE